MRPVPFAVMVKVADAAAVQVNVKYLGASDAVQEKPAPVAVLS